MTEPIPPVRSSGVRAADVDTRGTGAVFWDLCRRTGRVVAINLVLLGVVCAHNWSRFPGSARVFLVSGFAVALGAPVGALWACRRRIPSGDGQGPPRRAYRLVTWAGFASQAVLAVVLGAALLRSR